VSGRLKATHHRAATLHRQKHKGLGLCAFFIHSICLAFIKTIYSFLCSSLCALSLGGAISFTFFDKYKKTQLITELGSFSNTLLKRAKA
jgi:hypothetical protein